jgi:hypothetical protein
MVWELLQDVVLDLLQSDQFVWKWSPDGKYSASSAYRAFFSGSTELLGAKVLWQTKAPLCVKFFFMACIASASMDCGAPDEARPPG